MLVAWFWTLLASFLQFIQRLSLSFWLSIFVSIFLGYLANFVFSSIVLMCHSRQSIKNFDGPPSRWLHGHTDRATFDGNGLKFHIECATKYKTAYPLWFGPLRAALVLCHPDSLRVILSNHVPKEEFVYSLIVPFTGKSLTVVNGKRWQQMRKLLTPAFHADILRPYVKLFQESTNTLLEKWSKNPEKMECFKDLGLMALDSTLKCAFSFHSNCQSNVKQDEFTRSITAVSKALIKRLITPILHPDWIFRWTTEGRSFYYNCESAHETAETIIKTRRKTLQEKGNQNNSTRRKHLDMVDILLQIRDEDGNALTDKEIRAEVVTFFSAGQDTVAAGISWTLYNLALYSQHQEKCKEEIDEVFADKKEIEWDDLVKLKYVTLVIKESLRLYPPFPMFSRGLDKSYEIDGKVVPQGTWIMINAYALHHNPHVWKDPEVFDPLRFTTENREGRSPFAYIPFSAGPRNCIGMNFAMAEMKMAVAMILRRFELSISMGNQVHSEDLFPEIMLRTRNGIRLNLVPRY
ncbi:cytochrome P450 4B1-like [Acropora muricata]|uniref:cytochrome P450 4B1-like n=1 Tax=Acropora millepora TaxID=45264 RepID=UPI001CF1EC61|nr:cytochrome P450 4B1-like [Acropora millepora]